MKIVKNPTNVQIATELCKKNPSSRYANLLGYDATKGTINEDNLKLFTDQPDIANEFISDMANKVVVQRAYDLFRDYEMPFKVFLREMSRLGDPEELLSAELATPEDYGIWFSYGENGWQKTCRTMDPWYDKIYKGLCKCFPDGIEGLEIYDIKRILGKNV